MRKIFILYMALLMIVFINAYAKKSNSGKLAVMEVHSPAFKHKGRIPKVYSCEGRNVSPAINWTDAPANTKSFVLICEDPDAPAGIWTHWIMYDIPKGVSRLPAALPAKKYMKKIGFQGINSWKKIGYGGPCPPKGTHRYYFKVYALDKTLDLLPEKASRTRILRYLKNSIVGYGYIMGTYKIIQ